MFENINKKIQKNIIFLIIILLLVLMILQYYKIKNKEGLTASEDITNTVNAAAANAITKATDNATALETTASNAEALITTKINVANVNKKTRDDLVVNSKAWKKADGIYKNALLRVNEARDNATTARANATTIATIPTDGNDAYTKDVLNNDATDYSIFTAYCNLHPSDMSSDPTTVSCQKVCVDAIANPNALGYITCQKFCQANPTNADCIKVCQANPTNDDCMKLYPAPTFAPTFAPTMSFTSLNCNTLC